jgi:hypothetical protein
MLAQELNAVHALADRVPGVAGVYVAATEVRVVALAVNEPHRFDVPNMVMVVMVTVMIVVMAGVLFEAAAVFELVVAAGVSAEIDFETASAVPVIAASAAELKAFGLGHLGTDDGGTERQTHDQSPLETQHRTIPHRKGFEKGVRRGAALAPAPSRTGCLVTVTGGADGFSQTLENTPDLAT